MRLGEKNKRTWTIADKGEEKILRTKTKPVDFATVNNKELEELITTMRSVMVRFNGIGLSANQIGIPLRVFVAQLPQENGKGYKGKFYAVFNPKIVKKSLKKVSDEEGCLSVPGVYGSTPRSYKVTLEGFDKKGVPLSITAEGLLARIFQHEVDHLDGKIFIDRAQNLFTLKRE